MTLTAYLKAGCHGQALRLSHEYKYWVQANQNREYMITPLTVECWARLNSSHKKNVILSDGYAVTGYNHVTNHWALYTEKDSGYLCVRLQCRKPAIVRTVMNAADGRWHFIMMVYESDRLRLYADGLPLADTRLTEEVSTIELANDRSNEGPLYFGCYRPDGETCDGMVEEVRISRVARTEAQPPVHPLESDHSTVGLWRFNELQAGDMFADLSPTKNHARILKYLPTLDDNDRRDFGVQTSPFDRKVEHIQWSNAPDGVKPEGATAGATDILLHGEWDCLWAEPSGRNARMMNENEDQWSGRITCRIPCSVQTALFEAGLAGDPMVMKNNLHLSWAAEKEWWLRKRFSVPAAWRGRRISLHFDGVDYRASFWLNGRELGQHEGMFGGPDYDVSHLLRYDDSENTLVIRLDPAPVNYEDTFQSSVAYGWHYVKLITLGIWRPVHLRAYGATNMQSPFMRTKEVTAEGAVVELSLDCWHQGDAERLVELTARLTPRNFDGDGYEFTRRLTVKPGQNHFCFSGTLNDVKLWWPVDLGEPNLYEMQLTLKDDEGISDRYRCNWGARKIETISNSSGPHPHLYELQYVVNGKPLWLKGANWCYPDALLRLDRARNQRFVELARHAHVQLLRVWGGGPVENDEFYDVCDEMGMMVQQEFALLGFHNLQCLPLCQAAEMAEHAVQRLRNRPSLAIWSAANEISGLGAVVEVIGRNCIEFDGTRPFHRSCPYGGDVHWYGVYWEDRPMLDYRRAVDGRLETWCPGMGGKLNEGPIGFTEFGLSSPPNMETWKRIVPAEELNDWPPKPDSVFLHHTPTWNMAHANLMTRYARDFIEPTDFPRLITGMQIAQGYGLKMLIESMRARKPYTTTAYVYKLTENYPACSWALIDYYGAPKRSHYFVRQAYEPIHAMALFEDWSSRDDRLKVTLAAVNDSWRELRCELKVTLFDGMFNPVCSESFGLTLPVDRAVIAAERAYELPSSVARPVFLVLSLDGQDVAESNWYVFDFAEKRDCLFACPTTRLTGWLEGTGDRCRLHVRNTGPHPAICVDIHPGEASNCWYAERSQLWLNPGEEIPIILHSTPAVDGNNRQMKEIIISAWNTAPERIKL